LKDGLAEDSTVIDILEAAKVACLKCQGKMKFLTLSSQFGILKVWGVFSNQKRREGMSL